MKVRILTNTDTRINENWNPYGDINSSTQDPYVDDIINTFSNSQFSTRTLQEDFYKDVGIDIVTETIFDYPNPQITEKTFRPIVNKKMFIIVGAANSLHYLKTLGFKTFDNFINEDYDDIKDPIKRFNFLCNEIKRICDLDITSINDAIIDNKDIIEHNFNNYKTLQEEDYKRLDNIFNNL